MQREYVRKCFHISGFIFALLNYYGFPLISVFLLILAIVMYLFMYEIRTKFVIQILQRNDKIDTGALSYFTSIILVSLLPKLDISAASITFLTIGDALDTIIINHSNPRTYEKTLGFIPAFIIAWSFVPFFVALSGALISILLEILPLRYGKIVDDNLSIPIASYLIMTITGLLLA